MRVIEALRRAAEEMEERGRREGANYYQSPPTSRAEVYAMIAEALSSTADQLDLLAPEER